MKSAFEREDEQMQQIKRIHAFIAAAMILSAAVFHTVPEFTIRTDAGRLDSVRDFMAALSAAQTSASEQEDYSVLRYAQAEKCLYRDGTAVGDSYQEFAVQDGKLTVCADAFGISCESGSHISTEEASARAGCEIREDNGDLLITAPFRTARLIVRAAETPPLYGGYVAAEGFRDLHVLQYDSAEQAYTAYLKLKDDPDVIFAEPDRTFAAAFAGTAQQPETAAQSVIGQERSWGVADIGADAYCEWLTGLGRELPEIVTAVIDTGIYAEHSWFADRIAPGGAGFIMESNGSCADDHGHGTHCAGIIVQSTPENVHILPIKAMNSNA